MNRIIRNLVIAVPLATVGLTMVNTAAATAGPNGPIIIGQPKDKPEPHPGPKFDNDLPLKDAPKPKGPKDKAPKPPKKAPKPRRPAPGRRPLLQLPRQPRSRRRPSRPSSRPSAPTVRLTPSTAPTSCSSPAPPRPSLVAEDTDEWNGHHLAARRRRHRHRIRCSIRSTQAHQRLILGKPELGKEPHIANGVGLFACPRRWCGPRRPGARRRAPAGARSARDR